MATVERSQRQREAIIAAAAAVFAERGYRGAGTDQIAALASVSKQTLYKHFPGKDRLFSEVVLATTNELDALFGSVTALPDTVEELARELRVIARRFVATLIRPEVIQIRRLVIAEADRFPELGRTFYERGPERVAASLVPWFLRLARRGLLVFDDPDLAVRHFAWLVLSVPWNQALFCGSGATFAPDELDRFADSGVRAFLTGHAPRHDA
jgi:TetR/AcrR family transcriptional regulator, mexJK operon transcriptional repressor